MMVTSEAYVIDDVFPYMDNIVRPHRDTPAGRIEYFSDIFLEWFAFDDAHTGDIDKFLAHYGCADVFTTQQFIDLVMGDAYLNRWGVQYVVAKLPFVITCERAGILNAESAADNKSAYCINVPQSVVEPARADRKKEIRRKYNKSHKQQIAHYNHDYLARNRDALRQKYHDYYYENHADIRARKNDAARKRYAENREEIQARERAAYAANPTDKRACSIKYYQENRAECMRKNNAAYARRVARENQAQQMCPVFKFIYNLKKTQRYVYLTVFKPTEHIVDKAWKKCAALKENNAGICPVMCGGDRDACPMARAYVIPDAAVQIPKYVAEVHTRQK